MVRRRKTHRRQRGRARPRVLVVCQIPSKHGAITWEDHEIVGYVDIQEGKPARDGVPYYRGWDAVPAELRGTIDIVLSINCPVALAIERGWVSSLDTPPASNVDDKQEAFQIFTRGLEVLRPGGHMLFPRVVSISPLFKAAVDGKGHTAEVIEVPKPRWRILAQSDEYDINADYSRDVLPAVRVTKGATGGRRRKTRKH